MARKHRQRAPSRLPPAPTGKHLLKQRDGVMSLYADMGTIDGLAMMFKDRGVILPAWVHYLAFDLVAAHFVVQKNLK